MSSRDLRQTKLRITTSQEHVDTRLGGERRKRLPQVEDLGKGSSHKCNPGAWTPWDEQRWPLLSVPRRIAPCLIISWSGIGSQTVLIASALVLWGFCRLNNSVYSCVVVLLIPFVNKRGHLQSSGLTVWGLKANQP